MELTSRTPAALRWAIWLIWLEAAAAGGLAVLLGYQSVVTGANSRVDAVALTGFVVLVAAALSGLALALARHKARARAPAVVLQLFAVMSSVVTMTGGLAWWPVPVTVLGVAVTTLLFTPAVTAALGEGTAR